MIKILVVDDHTLVRDGLCRILENEKGIQVVGQAGSGHEAVRMSREIKPDVVLLDYNLPDIDGLEVTSQILSIASKIKVLILTMHANEEYAIRVIQMGASGFVIKMADSDELIEAIRKVARGGIAVSQSIMEKMVGRMGTPTNDNPESILSNREMQVLVRLARGATIKEISKYLSLSPSTVETYRSRVMEKLNLRNNSDITRFSIKRNLIDPD